MKKNNLLTRKDEMLVRKVDPNVIKSKIYTCNCGIRYIKILENQTVCHWCLNIVDRERPMVIDEKIIVQEWLDNDDSASTLVANGSI